MKAIITPDFLRGIIFTFAVYKAYNFGSVIHLGFSPSQPIHIIGAAFFSLLYLFIALATVFCTPHRTKGIFVFLCLVAVFTVFYVAYSLTIASFRLNVVVILNLILAIAPSLIVTYLSFVLYRWSTKNLAEPDAAANS